MFRVFVSRPIPEEGLSLLRREADVLVGPDRPLAREELIAHLRGCDGWVSMLTDRVDAELLASLPKLRVVANYAVGYDNFDLPAATEHRVLLTNTPDVLTEATADYTWALLLAVARRVVEGDRALRSGGFTGWAPLYLLGREVHGQTLGLVGLGRIGRAVARRAVGFGMRVLYAGHRPRPELSDAEFRSLPELLSEADFVSLHVPLTAETRHLLDREALRRMKPGAFLINTARGAVVDEAALLEVLAEGRLGGAALDVYEYEPRVTEGLLALPNVVLSPHLGSATVETRGAMAVRAAENLLAALRGERPRDLLNPEAFGL